MSTRIISLRLPDELVDQIDQFAAETKISRNKLFELAIRHQLDVDAKRKDSDRLKEMADRPFSWRGDSGTRAR
jgi:metal-responsive CopG/Arc/MetJ family transcriptional regulator